MFYFWKEAFVLRKNHYGEKWRFKRRSCDDFTKHINYYLKLANWSYLGANLLFYKNLKIKNATRNVRRKTSQKHRNVPQKRETNHPWHFRCRCVSYNKNENNCVDNLYGEKLLLWCILFLKNTQNNKNIYGEKLL